MLLYDAWGFSVFWEGVLGRRGDGWLISCTISLVLLLSTGICMFCVIKSVYWTECGGGGGGEDPVPLS